MLAKHSKSFSLIDCISVGVDGMQRNFEPMRKQVDAWQRSELTDVTAKVVIYEVFVEGRLEAPKHNRFDPNSGSGRPPILLFTPYLLPFFGTPCAEPDAPLPIDFSRSVYGQPLDGGPSTQTCVSNGLRRSD